MQQVYINLLALPHLSTGVLVYACRSSHRRRP